MCRLGIFQLILLAEGFICVLGYKHSGITLDPRSLSPIENKIQSIVTACSEKGVEFNADEISAKISSCFELFNKLGKEEKEYPDVKYVLGKAWENVTDEEVEAYAQSRRENHHAHAKYGSQQLKSTLECFEPIKTIIDQCESSEGITIFSVLEEVWQNDGLPFYELLTAVNKCGGTREFQNAFDSCQDEAGVIKKYWRPYPTEEILLENFCEIGSAQYNCLEFGIASNPSNCTETSELLQTFVEGVTSRASNVDALNQCFSRTQN